jgi:hypothetical protein
MKAAKYDWLEPDDAGGFLHLPQCGLGYRTIGRIDEHGNVHGLGHQLMQECHPLGDHLPGEIIDAGRVATRPRERRPRSIGIAVRNRSESLSAFAGIRKLWPSQRELDEYADEATSG